MCNVCIVCPTQNWYFNSLYRIVVRRTCKRSENCSTRRMTHRWALDGFSNQTMYTTFIPLLSLILTFASDSLCGSSTSSCYSNLRERVCVTHYLLCTAFMYLNYLCYYTLLLLIHSFRQWMEWVEQNTAHTLTHSLIRTLSVVPSGSSFGREWWDNCNIWISECRYIHHMQIDTFSWYLEQRGEWKKETYLFWTFE